MWCYIDMSHCEWAVCGYEGFLVLVSLLYVGLVRVVIRLKYIPVAAATGMYLEHGNVLSLVGIELFGVVRVKYKLVSLGYRI